ncbi:MAG: 5'-nucleotidase C-terminal domain-containing protein, partial [Myxococcales bacterium]|nr:5'-nucleotidase C-terminal domain-containing protein [Myxococcales bacterium]
DGAPLIGGDNVVRSRVLELGGVKVGLFSLMVDSHVPEYVEQINTDYVGVAKAAVAELRGQGAEVVLALTHLDARDDRKLLTELAGAAGPDMILGGHDHVLMTVEANGRLAIKGDADALRVRVVDMWVDKDGKVGWESDPSGVALGPEAPADDPAVAKVVEARLSEFEAKFCGEAGPGCLSKNLTVATTELIAEELEIRRYETNFADYIVDQMLTSFAADGAQLAFINSGALRLNQNIAAGTKISRQLIEETFAYPAPMQLIEIKGAVLQQVVDHAIEDWTGSGHWLQIGGFAFRHDVEAGKASGLTLLGPDGPTPIDPKKKYKVVTTEFLLDKSIGNQDGYKMLSKKQVIKSKAAGTDLKQVVLKALEAAGEQGVGPERDGRICSSDRASGACLAAK